MKKLLLATAIITSPVMADDRFQDIRQPWAMCSTCHGAMGQGGIGPALAGQSADDIINKLLHYKMGHKDGPQAAMMIPWAQSLTDGQIGTIGVFVQEGFPSE